MLKEKRWTKQGLDMMDSAAEADALVNSAIEYEAEKRYEKRREKGREEGRKEGENRKAFEVAENLFKIGLTSKQISASTGLTLKEIEKLKK